jgi:hypothetical protein
MSGNSTVEEGGTGIVNNLIEYEVLDLNPGSEWSFGSLVTDFQLGRLGDGVVVGIPHEPDSITNRSIDSEGNITENTLGRSDNDGVGNTRSRTATTVRGSLSGRWSPRLRSIAILCDALGDTIVIV